MSVVSAIVGAVTDSSARVVAKVSGSSATLQVGSSSFGPVPASSEGIVDLAATGLDAGTAYTYTVDDGGGTLEGAFRTFPAAGSQASFTFTYSSCAGSKPGYPAGGTFVPDRVSDSPVFDRVAAKNPLFNIDGGDLAYPDIGQDKHGLTGFDIGLYRQMYEAVLATRQGDLYRNVPLVYMWDDHDFCGDNSDGTSPAKFNAAAAYRERIPSYPLEEASGAIYHAFQCGRVQFAVLDIRYESDAPSGADPRTRLGSAQKTWLQNLLTSTDSEFLVVVQGQRWNVETNTGNTNWGSYQVERNDLVDMFGDHGWLGRMVMLSGDVHASGIDTGGGNPYGGFPLFHGGSLDSHMANTPGPLDLGWDYGPGHFLTLDVQDAGGYIRVTDHVWRLDGAGVTEVMAYSKTVLLEAPGVNDVDMLTYDPDLSRVRVDVAEIAAPTQEAWRDDFAGAAGAALSSSYQVALSGSKTNPPTLTGSGGVVHDSSQGGSFAVQDVALADADVSIGGVWLTETVRGWGLVACADLPLAYASSTDFVSVLASGYQLMLNNSQGVSLYRAGSSVATTAAPGFADGAEFVMRLRVQAGRVRARWWLAANAEPSAWDIDYSDGAPLSAGAAGFGAHGSGNRPVTQLAPFVVDEIVDAPMQEATVRVERSTDLVRWTTVRGGDTVPVSVDAAPVDDYEFAANVENVYRVSVVSDGETIGVYRDSTTVTIDKPWLKSISFPLLNREIDPAAAGDVTRPARAGVFDIVGRRDPIAVTDVRGSKRYELTVATVTAQEREDMDAAVAVGDVVYVQTPSSYPVPSGYYLVGDTTEARKGMPWDRRWFTLPLTGVAAPAPSITGATATTGTLLRLYPTCADLLAAQ
ncbi:MAG: alkaline phosphatase D family protein, partial [Nocardioidaceae bacterium]